MEQTIKLNEGGVINNSNSENIDLRDLSRELLVNLCIKY